MINESVSVGPRRLPGRFEANADPHHVIVFAHGGGSSHLSARNQAVARILRWHGFATLLFDLLSTRESSDRYKVFDIALLAERLGDALDWTRQRLGPDAGSTGLFGSSTGAAVVLRAAAERPSDVQAVVARGGRVDLATSCLGRVHAPTLLIVGSLDPLVLKLNRTARELLGGVSQLTVVPGASHLFQEPGTLDLVGHLSAGWFKSHLSAAAPPPASPSPAVDASVDPTTRQT